MKILITGKGSFIGSNFIRHSEFKQIDEISLLDFSPEEIDFRNYDVVLHVAAIVHQNKKIPENHYFIINRDLCLRTATCAKQAGVKQFVFISTLKVYGEVNKKNVPRNENSVCSPSDPYGRSKFEAENALRKIEDNNFVVSILRSSVVYGEGVKANILSLIKLVEKTIILPLGGINNKRNFIYIENLVGYIDVIIKKRSSGVFIAIDEKSYSTTEIINYISKSLNKKIILFRLPGYLINTGRFLMPATFLRLFGSLEFENTETLKKLEYKIPYSTEEGIRRTIIAYNNNRLATKTHQ